VHAPPWAIDGLRAQFGASTRIGAELDDGRVEVELGAPSAGIFAEQLAGWGDLIEVVEPADLRDRLRRLGEDLVARYGVVT